MIRAKLETRHFTFEAYAETETEALELLRFTWNSQHRKHYADAKPFDEFVGDDDVCFFEVKVGTAYRDGEAFKAVPSQNTLARWIAEARPLDDDEWGSERQINSANTFWELCELAVTRDQFDAMESFNLKATTDEMLDNAADVLGMSLDLKRPITTATEGEVFIRALIAAGKDFHFDDNPATIINGHTGKRLWLDSEFEDVSKRVEELFHIFNDPFEPLLDIQGRDL